MIIEEWRDIEGYEGFYQVSDMGGIRSLDRLNSRGSKLKGRAVKLNPNGSGYLKFGTCKNGVRATKTVHVIVATTFLGHKPGEDGLVVDHKWEDKLDNRANSLQLISHRENLSKDKKGGSSKYVGVCWDKPHKRWRSRIGIDGDSNHLGLFTSELEASDAYQDALAKI